MEALEKWMIIRFTPNHDPTKMNVLPKTLVQIILAAKFLVRHSSTSPNQQRRPLPSLLSLSLFYGYIVVQDPYDQLEENHMGDDYNLVS